MNEEQIQSALENAWGAYRRLKNMEKVLQKEFPYPFLVLQNSGEDNCFRLFFDLDEDLIEIQYLFKQDGFERISSFCVRLVDNIVCLSVPKKRSTEEAKRCNKKIYDIAKTFLNLIKELNDIRLLAVTGMIQLKEEMIYVNVYLEKC